MTFRCVRAVGRVAAPPDFPMRGNALGLVDLAETDGGVALLSARGPLAGVLARLSRRALAWARLSAKRFARSAFRSTRGPSPPLADATGRAAFGVALTVLFAVVSFFESGVLVELRVAFETFLSPDFLAFVLFLSLALLAAVSFVFLAVAFLFFEGVVLEGSSGFFSPHPVDMRQRPRPVRRMQRARLNCVVIVFHHENRPTETEAQSASFP